MIFYNIVFVILILSKSCLWYFNWTVYLRKCFLTNITIQDLWPVWALICVLSFDVKYKWFLTNYTFVKLIFRMSYHMILYLKYCMYKVPDQYEYSYVLPNFIKLSLIVSCWIRFLSWWFMIQAVIDKFCFCMFSDAWIFFRASYHMVRVGFLI